MSEIPTMEEVTQRLNASMPFDKPGALKRLGNDQELLQEVIAIFLEDVSNQVNQIVEGIESENLDTITHFAHQLKGASGNVGAEELYLLTEGIELIGRAGGLAEVQQLGERLPAALQRFQKALD